MPEDRHPEQCEIADDVDDFVTNKLIGTSQPFFVENASFRRQHDCVIKRPATSEAHVPQRFNLLKKPKRSGRSEMSRELPVGNFDVIPLSSDHRMRELNQTRNRECRSRTDTHSTITLSDFHSLQY